MKTKLTYWLPSIGASAGLLTFLLLSAFLLAWATSAHAAPTPCVELLEHCSHTLVADASLHNVDDPSMPGLALAQADGLASPAATVEPVSTSTPVAVPTDATGFVEDGTAAVKAFASKDYLYAVGFVLFLLIGAYELFGQNVVPPKDRILVTLLLPALIAGAGALCLHATILGAGQAAGAALASAFMAEGGIAVVLPMLKAAFGIGAAPKPTA